MSKAAYPTITILSALQFACSSISPVSPADQLSISVTPPEQNRLSYKGPGAGAGMMLMGAMGPMGVALGIAIDEGIRKDIEEDLVATGFDAVDIVQRDFYSLIGQSCAAPISDTEFGSDLLGLCSGEFTEVSINIYEYGVESGGGEGGPSTAYWSLGISVDEQPDNIFDSRELPEVDADMEANSAPLDLLKEDGFASFALLETRLSELLTSWAKPVSESANQTEML